MLGIARLFWRLATQTWAATAGNTGAQAELQSWVRLQVSRRLLWMALLVDFSVPRHRGLCASASVIIH